MQNVCVCSEESCNKGKLFLTTEEGDGLIKKCKCLSGGIGHISYPLMMSQLNTGDLSSSFDMVGEKAPYVGVIGLIRYNSSIDTFPPSFSPGYPDKHDSVS